MKETEEKPITVKDCEGKDVNIKNYQKSLNDWPSYAHKVMSDDGTTALTNACYKTYKCGCRVTGCGTLQFPVEIEYCNVHGNAHKLLDAVSQTVEFHNQIRGMSMQKKDNDVRLKLRKVLMAAIEAATQP